MVNLVKIHGRYCGPDWTAGRAISAEDYLRANPNVADWPNGIDPLDNACRLHDIDCARNGQCTRSGDTALIRAANRRRLTQAQIARRQVRLLNPFLSAADRQRIQDRLEESRRARQIVAGITVSRRFRRM